VIVGLPAGFASYRHTNLRNFRVVKPGLLYRSGQMTVAGWERVINDHGIKTVVSLRDTKVDGKPPPDKAEEEYVRKLDLGYLRLAPQPWWGRPNAPIPADANVAKFLAVMDDPKSYPVLVHCFAGIHRTGAYLAIYRMEYDRWDNAAALAELRANGYVNVEDEEDVFDYLTAYKPRWSRGK